MKKAIFSVLMLLMLSLVANAQIKTSRQYTSIDLDIKVKRCVVSGTQGYIDLVFTNNTGKHMSNEKDTCVRFLNGEMSYYEKIMENIFGVC
jgi:hypothetical protein